MLLIYSEKSSERKQMDDISMCNKDVISERLETIYYMCQGILGIGISNKLYPAEQNSS